MASASRSTSTTGKSALADSTTESGNPRPVTTSTESKDSEKSADLQPTTTTGVFTDSEGTAVDSEGASIDATNENEPGSDGAYAHAAAMESGFVTKDPMVDVVLPVTHRPMNIATLDGIPARVEESPVMMVDPHSGVIVASPDATALDKAKGDVDDEGRKTSKDDEDEK